MKQLLKKHAEKLRFGLVGLVNTTIDFGILFGLVALGLPTLVSNFVSTSVALSFSYIANKKFTFKHTGKNSTKQMVYFLVITLFGLWIIQPVIIEETKLFVSQFVENTTFGKYLILCVGKGLATFASLTWNYLLYRKFVFIRTDQL